MNLLKDRWMSRWFLKTATRLAIAASVALNAPPLCADVVVNPNGDGSTNVEHGSDTIFTATLTNPLANILDLRPDNLYVGTTSTGELRVFTDALGTGVLQNADGYIGHDASAVGKITVEGGAIWNNEGNLTVGREGNGTLDILSGGLVGASADVIIGDQNNATGAVTIDGTDSRLTSNNLIVGEEGIGTLDITDGGLASSVQVNIGNGFARTGTATVDGAGSRLETSILSVADGSITTGTLAITNGGVVELGTNSLTNIGKGSGANGTILVDGPGSMLLVPANPLFILGRDGGSGLLNITNGGKADIDTIEVAREGTGTVGTINVDGVGSQLIVSSGILLGLFGPSTTATLNIRNGGLVLAGGIIISEDSDSVIRDATLNIQAGGTLRIENNLTEFKVGTLNLSGGTLAFAGDRFYDAAPGDRSNLNGFLTPRGSTLLFGQTLEIEGALSLLAPITIDGGGLVAGSIDNLASVDLKRGMLELTGMDLDVSAAVGLGDTVALLGIDRHLKVHQTVHVAGDGRLELNGGRLSTGLLDNSGVVTGSGRIDGPLDNGVDGEVRLGIIHSLLFTGSGSTNDGEINLLGGSLEFEQDLTNLPTGRIVGRGGLIVEGGADESGGDDLLWRIHRRAWRRVGYRGGTDRGQGRCGGDVPQRLSQRGCD